MAKRVIGMPIECVSNPLQRELADSILRFSPLDELRILLACGANPNDPVTQGLRPLHYAVWQHYTEAVRFLLVRGSDVNARDECGYTAMHLSAEHGFTDIMQILLEFQAKVNFTEEKSRDLICDEPLHLAIKNGHFASAQLLLENGANVNARYFFGCEINLISPLNTVAMQMLLMYGADPDSRDRTGLTPLMKACRLPQRSSPLFEQATETVLLLLHYGADVNAMADERNDYRSVLHFAVLSGNHAMVRLLIKQGARPRAPSGHPADRKPSALDLAVLRGDVDLVRMLIEAGADVNHTSSVLGSALHVACTDHVPNRIEIVRLLLESGADPNIVAKSDEGLLLQPILGEYITANAQRPEFEPEVIKLLLRHGAQVVLKTQHRHPLGIYSILPMLTRHPRVFVDMILAAECFDPVMLKRSNPMSVECKQFMMQHATQPATLCHQVRLFLRRHLRTQLHLKIPQLEIPAVLHSFLLFDIS